MPPDPRPHDSDSDDAVDPSRGLVPATALTTVRDLTKVRGPEDLPPSVARELAEIVATHRPTVGDFLRGVWPWFAVLPVFAIPAVVAGSWAHLVPSLVGIGFGLYATWRGAPFRKADEHMKELGIGWRGRRRIVKKLAAVVGAVPAEDIAARPSAEHVFRQLEPGGVDIVPTGKVVAHRISRAEEMDDEMARSVAGQWLEWRTRTRLNGLLNLGVLAWLGIVLGSLATGLPLAILAVLFAVGTGGSLLGQLIVSVAGRRHLRTQLREAGLDKKEQQRVLRACRDVARRRELRRAPRAERMARIAAGLQEVLGIRSSSQPALEPGSTDTPR